MNKELHGTAALLHKINKMGGIKNYASELIDNGFCQGVMVTTAIALLIFGKEMLSNKIESLETKAKLRH